MPHTFKVHHSHTVKMHRNKKTRDSNSEGMCHMYHRSHVVAGKQLLKDLLATNPDGDSNLATAH